MKSLAVLLVSFGLLVATCGVAWWLWNEVEAATITFYGWLALGIGGGLTVLLAAGLVALMQFSERRGYDDAAGRDH